MSTGSLTQARTEERSRNRGSGAGKLIGKTVRVASLDEPTMRAAFQLLQSSYDGVEWEKFVQDLNEKQLIILMRDKADRTLQGFSTVAVQDVQVGKRRGQVVFSGDTVISKEYWGQKELYRQFSRMLIRLKVRHPLRGLYWFLISKGYKTYLIITSTTPHMVPRFDQQDVPKLRVLVDQLSTQRFGDKYDPATGVITGSDRVRDGIAPVDKQLMSRNPHVKFFVEKNPGHESGDELACLSVVRFRDSVGTLLRVTAKKFRKQSGRR